MTTQKGALGIIVGIIDIILAFVLALLLPPFLYAQTYMPLYKWIILLHKSYGSEVSLIFMNPALLLLFSGLILLNFFVAFLLVRIVTGIIRKIVSMNTQKEASGIIIGIIVAVLILGGGGGYYFLVLDKPIPFACTKEAKVCPDGSTVGRVSPSCEFAVCPGEKTSVADKDALDDPDRIIQQNSRLTDDEQCTLADYGTLDVDYPPKELASKTRDEDGPAFTSYLSSRVAYIGEHYDDLIIAVSPSYEPISLYFEKAPEGMTIEQYGRVSWTPTSNNSTGAHNIVLVAEDEQGRKGKLSYYLELKIRDYDGDGMDNFYECVFLLLDPTDPSDADDDIDSDGLTNLEEFQNRTIPSNADSDGDGVSDGSEVKRGRDPLHKDNFLWFF
ncbi:hypothetical protein ACFL3E_02130 [Patescibacteria group bacterium]